MMRGLATTGLLLVALLTLGGTPAQAGVETFSAVIPVTPTPFTTAFTIQGFDPTLGTLTSVNITTVTSGTASISVINTDASSSHTFTDGTAVFLFKLTDPTGGISTTASTATVATGTVPGGSPFGAATYAGLPVAGMSSDNIGSGGLSSFITPGGVNLNFSAHVGGGTYGGTETDGSGNLFFGGSGSVGATITVTYTYSVPAAVPEPASLGLLSVGLIGIGGLSARRMRRSAV